MTALNYWHQVGTLRRLAMARLLPLLLLASAVSCRARDNDTQSSNRLRTSTTDSAVPAVNEATTNASRAAELSAAEALDAALSPPEQPASQPATGTTDPPEAPESAAESADTPPDPSDAFFAAGRIPELRIVLSPEQEQKLREDQRRYVKCTLLESLRDPEYPSQVVETTYQNVAVKIKGAAGSSRDLDDKPALTLNADKYSKGQRFHGMDKIHLNNSVQDPSYLNEWICADLAREMAVVAPRVTHARVWLNERDLGLFVLKEGFDKVFLMRHFQNASGNLYDGGFCADIDTPLEKDEGKNPEDRGDLIALRAACTEPDAARRAERIAELLDIEAFLRFTALEMMSCHWDGYVRNMNNYRIYFDPSNGQARFLPHGMDQMFGDPGFPVLEQPSALVAQAVLSVPEWQAEYNRLLVEFLPLLASSRLNERLDEGRTRLQPVVASLGEEAARSLADHVNDFRSRLSQREASLREQLRHEPPAPAEFDEAGMLVLTDWYGAKETEDSKLEELKVNGVLQYSIEVGDSAQCVASFRRHVLLAPGRYRIEARLKADGIEPSVDEQGAGGGVRISGGTRINKLSGTSRWRTVGHDFEVTDGPRDVIVVLELRATKGRLTIDSRVVLKVLPE